MGFVSGRGARTVPRLPERSLVLRLCPNVILTASALLSLLFGVWFGSLAALGFLMSGFLLWVRRPADAISDVLRYWPIHVLSLWCLLSTFWSNEPQVTLRLSIQLALTILVAVAIATRLAPRTLILTAFVAFGVAAVASLLFGEVRSGGLGWIGIFGSKNAFAFAMSIFTLLSLALLLDARSWTMRALACGALPLGVLLLVLGQSVGALASTGVACLLGLSLFLLRGVPQAGRLIVLVTLVLGSVALLLLAVGYRAELARAFFDVTGKDVTLTGRTVLWSEALREIRAHPLLGQGYQAFWVHGNPVAEDMWALFGIGSRSGFHFHNTWLTNAVEIGLLGIAIQLGLFLATLVLVARWVSAIPSAASLFFAMFMARQAALSFVEAVVYYNFDVVTILSIAALVYGLRVQAEMPTLRARALP